MLWRLAGNPDRFCFDLGDALEIGRRLRHHVDQQSFINPTFTWQEAIRRATPELYASIRFDAPVGARNQDRSRALGGLIMDDCQVDTVRLALQWVYGTAEFFDEDPMPRLRPCNWSSDTVREKLRRQSGEVVVMNDAWKVDGQRWKVPEVVNRSAEDVERRRGQRLGVIQADYAGTNRRGNIDFLLHEIDDQGRIRNPTLDSVLPGLGKTVDSTQVVLWDGGEWNPDHNSEGKSYG